MKALSNTQAIREAMCRFSLWTHCYLVLYWYVTAVIHVMVWLVHPTPNELPLGESRWKFDINPVRNKTKYHTDGMSVFKVKEISIKVENLDL